MMQVLIAFFQGETTMVPKNAKWVDVNSLEDAKEKVLSCIEENGLGGRDWFGGIVRDEKKLPTHVVQYDGRICTAEEDATFIKNAKRLLSKP